MAETLLVSKSSNKEERYRVCLPQIKALLEAETDGVANMANVSAVLKETFSFFWCGFYVVKNNELVLGPFQGPLACTRIACGKGVCGKAWEKKEILIVPDVEKFPGHIACSSLSKSEIVVPLVYLGEVIAVLDIDSDRLDAFDETDRFYLDQVGAMVAKAIHD